MNSDLYRTYMYYMWSKIVYNYRNICAGGSDEVVEKVVKLKVLDPLAELLLESNEKCHTPLENPTSPSKLPSAMVLENPEVLWSQILINSMNLMWNLWYIFIFSLHLSYVFIFYL